MINSSDVQDGTLQNVDFADLFCFIGASPLSIYFQGGSILFPSGLVVVSAGSVALADDSVNYVQCDSSGVVSANTSGFSAGKLPMACVTTFHGGISAVADKRAMLTVPASMNFVTGEVPAGTMNGTNTSFTLAHAPIAGSLEVFLRGLRHSDFAISGQNLTMVSIPNAGDDFRVNYQF